MSFFFPGEGGGKSVVKRNHIIFFFHPPLVESHIHIIYIYIYTLDALVACGKFWARHLTHATAAPQAAAVTTPDP